jgi:electron transfer flavoprotein alpha subunit
MADYKGVMIFAEIEGGKLSALATELIGCARKLAGESGQQVSAILAGSGIANFAQEVIAFGADKVFVVDDPMLKDYQTDTYIQVMDKIIKQASPAIFLMGQTAVGRDLSPRLAFKLNTATVMDCVDLSIDKDSKKLLQTKPVYGGNAQAIYTSDSYPQMATVRAKAMSALAKDPARKGEIVNIPAGLEPSALKAKLVNKVKEEVAGIKLEDAAVIVSGGRGIGGAEGFKQLEELAKVLKGAVGASRPPCDNGWLPSSLQVGLTGKIVSPDVYFAIAISGSSQHMSGCSGSKSIIAINKDPEANIFKVARFGVVGDWKKVLPALTAKVKELVAG